MKVSLPNHLIWQLHLNIFFKFCFGVLGRELQILFFSNHLFFVLFFFFKYFFMISSKLMRLEFNTCTWEEQSVLPDQLNAVPAKECGTLV